MGGIYRTPARRQQRANKVVRFRVSKPTVGRFEPIRQARDGETGENPGFPPGAPEPRPAAAAPTGAPRTVAPRPPAPASGTPPADRFKGGRIPRSGASAETFSATPPTSRDDAARPPTPPSPATRADDATISTSAAPPPDPPAPAAPPPAHCPPSAADRSSPPRGTLHSACRESPTPAAPERSSRNAGTSSAARESAPRPHTAVELDAPTAPSAVGSAGTPPLQAASATLQTRHNRP